MAAKTTIKVALLSGAAKDDFFTTDATGLTEDLLLAALNVLGNDPGSARLYSLQQNLSGSGQMAQVNTAFSALGAMITINADGTIAYDASNIGGSLAHLAEGQLVTDTFVYTVRMGSGALSTAQVTLQIAGENDPPTLDSITPINIFDTPADDTPAAVTGMLPGHDVDDGAVLTYSLVDMTGVDTTIAGVQTKQLDYGTLTLHTDTGAYSFLADPDKIDTLPGGSTAEAVFAVVVTDGYASASQDLTFNLIGANEAAVITGEATGSVTEDGITTTDGKLLVSAPNAGAVGFVTTTSLQGTYGDFTFVNSSGLWDYTLRNGDANVQGLALNQHVSDTLTVTTQDGTASQIITVAVNGANDAPTLDQPVALRYVDTASNDSLLVKSSKLIGHDIDQANSPKPYYSLVNLTNVSVSGDNQNLIKNEGTFTLNTVTGEYFFQFKADFIDALWFSETSSFQIAVIAIDDQGAISDPQYITIQAVGDNDLATITGIYVGSVTEDGVQKISDQVLDSIDPDDRVTTSNPKFQEVIPDNLHGIFGNFTFNSRTGVWDYTLRNDDANVQALAAGQQEFDTLTVTSQDGTASQTITVTVNGMNDPATITGTFYGSVWEDGILTASAKVDVTDPDDNPANPLFQEIFEDALRGTYGNFSFNASTGDWGYTLRNDDANVQALAATQYEIDKLTVTTKDGTATQEIRVAVNGRNDDAQITGTLTGSVTEDGAQTAGGKLDVLDPDDNPANPLFQSIGEGALHGTYGNFSFDASTGVWGYTLRNIDDNVQALNASDQYLDKLTVTSQDGSEWKEIEVTVNGANEPAIGDDTSPIFTFDVNPTKFDESGIYEIFDFTSNDFIRFSRNVSILGHNTVDHIADSNNREDSIDFSVGYMKDSTYMEGHVYLVNVLYLQSGQFI